MLGIRKLIKQNLAEKVSFKNLPDLTGSVYFYGKIGGGKTTSLISFAQKYHDDNRKKYKIFDVWGGDRNEHLYWCFPSTNIKYWQRAKKFLTLDEDGPKQYKVHLLYPCWKATTPTKLPFDAPNIKSSIFTIPIKSVSYDDLMTAIGLLSENDKYVWREATEKLKRNDGSKLLNYYAKKYGTKNQILLKNFIEPATRNMLLAHSTASTNFDVVEEMKDRDTISILCLEFIPKELRLFVMRWLVQQVAVSLDAGKIRPKNIFLIREAAEFFRATDDSLMSPTYKIFRSQLAHFLRMGRRGMHFFLDAQSPRETKGLVDGQQDLTLLCRLPSEGDREDATIQLYRDNLITKRQIQQLATLEPGQVMFVESGKRVKLRYILLPRTRYWQPGDGSFYESSWKSMNNNWKNFEEIASELSKKYEEESDFLKTQELIDQQKKEQHKKESEAVIEEDKKKREEEEMQIYEDRLKKKLELRKKFRAEQKIASKKKEQVDTEQKSEVIEKDVAELEDSNINKLEDQLLDNGNDTDFDSIFK